MDDTEIVVERRLGDEEVGDRHAMPHAVMMGEVALQPQRPFEDVRRRGNNLEAGMESIALRVVVSRRLGRVESFELPDRTDIQRCGKFGQLTTHDRIVLSHRSALVDDPASYRHISSDANTS